MLMGKLRCWELYGDRHSNAEFKSMYQQGQTSGQSSEHEQLRGISPLKRWDNGKSQGGTLQNSPEKKGKKSNKGRMKLTKESAPTRRGEKEHQGKCKGKMGEKKNRRVFNEKAIVGGGGKMLHIGQGGLRGSCGTNS